VAGTRPAEHFVAAAAAAAVQHKMEGPLLAFLVAHPGFAC